MSEKNKEKELIKKNKKFKNYSYRTGNYKIDVIKIGRTYDIRMGYLNLTPEFEIYGIVDAYEINEFKEIMADTILLLSLKAVDSDNYKTFLYSYIGKHNSKYNLYRIKTLFDYFNTRYDLTKITLFEKINNNNDMVYSYNLVKNGYKITEKEIMLDHKKFKFFGG